MLEIVFINKNGDKHAFKILEKKNIWYKPSPNESVKCCLYVSHIGRRVHSIHTMVIGNAI